MTKRITSLITTLISLLLILLGTVGLVALQKPLQEKSQDVRSDASVSGGQITVSGSPSSGSTLNIETTTIDFRANTQGVQTDGVQLVFNIITNTLGSTPSISVPSGSGLQNSYSNVEQTGDGYLVSVIALPQQIGQTFSSTSATTIAQLRLPITQAGGVEISFDPEKSKSIIHDTNPPQDSLNHVSALNYTVSNGSTACTEDAKQCPDGSSVSRVAPNCEFAACPDDNDDNSDNNDSNDDAGTGGVTVKGCNLSCSSNSECETDHRCYNGQCRLVTNVSSTSCQPVADQGLSRGCNQYCADSQECGYGYSCLENKCRRADNPDDSYCNIPASTVQQGIAEGCNKACGTNADCAMNLRCYYGSCRLATSPSSTTCSAVTTKTVSSLYTKTKTVEPKGGDLMDQESTDSATPAAIIATPTPSPSSSPVAKGLPEEMTALDSVLNSMRNSGLPVNLFPFLALGAGFLLLLVVFIPKIFGGKKTQIYQPKPPVASTNNQYEKELQAKLDEMKRSTPPPAAPVSKPAKPVVKPPVKTQISVEKPSIPPTPSIDTKPFAKPKPPQSPMMERVKDKGIVPPQPIKK